MNSIQSSNSSNPNSTKAYGLQPDSQPGAVAKDSLPAYRAVILGCGERARQHAPALTADPRIQVVALADVSKEAADAFNRDFELGAKIYSDIDDLLAQEQPDIAVIALWTHLHLPVFQACVKAGVRLVLCEKPMAATWGECQTIAQIAEESGTILTFCHQRRFASGNRMVRALLDEGQFGQIERMDLFSPPHLLDCGTHSVDQALSFNHDLPVKWVHGAVDLSSTVNFFGIKAEGMSTGVFLFENEVHATIRTGRQDMDFWGGVRVTGSEGFVEVFWDGQIRRAILFGDPSWTFPTFEEVPGEQMIGVVRNAIDALESGSEPELSYRKAMRATEILFALYESARRHERIELPLSGVTGNPLHEMLDAQGQQFVQTAIA